MTDVEVPLDNPTASVFRYVQQLMNQSSQSATKNDKLKRLWEPTYT
jgi:hypothetical protein